ncbi:uncharacterized protein LOC110098462 [Dendrobium catenatum]|uniref:uncharacterized protein LOC110098462 n=1 Tax=Dendrobium catenatum TaxID=906689 RepID=UPI00109F1841|nr:uncharacterized protein LOC110098462 [Dendrobium catenatum]
MYDIIPIRYNDIVCWWPLLTFEEVFKTAVFDWGKCLQFPRPGLVILTAFLLANTSVHILGPQLFNAINNFFTTASLPRGVKACAITLIPKCSHASSINDYRPISLYNIILSSEILRVFKSSHKRFCAKLDIRKAFDSVSREFLLARMLQKCFPHIFVSWIKACISDVYFSICLNGSLEGFFNSTSGLRQGCPLSPLLLCVVMDGLSNILNRNTIFKGIAYKDVHINHLMYADDLLVFGESTKDNAEALKSSLMEFSSYSGLFINEAKSSIVFSHNDNLAQFISATLGIHQVNTSLTYLGLPISSKRLKNTHFQPLLSKISALLDGWKNKFLSFAGRVQFIKFTVINTIAYWIRGAIIPKSCCAYINKICSRFLFHSNIHEKKLHLIAWAKVTLTKHYGGLGIPSIEALYHGVFCSFIGRFYNAHNYLCSWYKSKFISPWKNPPVTASKFWKKINATAAKIRGYITFTVSNDCNFSFLWDPWFKDMILAEQFVIPNLEEKLVKDFITNGTWNFPPNTPSNLTASIAGLNMNEVSAILWNGSTNWKFKDFIEHFHSHLTKVDWFGSVWHKKHSLRYACFAWMALIGKLKTADNLIYREIHIDPQCFLCSSSTESHAHLFFECDFSFNILKYILPDFNVFLLRPNLIQAFEFIAQHDFYSRTEKDFCCLTTWEDHFGALAVALFLPSPVRLFEEHGAHFLGLLLWHFCFRGILQLGAILQLDNDVKNQIFSYPGRPAWQPGRYFFYYAGWLRDGHHLIIWQLEPLLCRSGLYSDGLIRCICSGSFIYTETSYCNSPAVVAFHGFAVSSCCFPFLSSLQVFWFL